MIKDKTAATCRTQWSVNDSRREGKKVINNNIKQVLLTFNTEYEHVIDKVKFNNFNSMEKRILKIYDKLKTLNASLHIVISSRYLELKMQELTLGYEYAQKSRKKRNTQESKKRFNGKMQGFRRR